MKAKAYLEDNKGNVTGVRFTDSEAEPFTPIADRKPQAAFASKEFTIADGKAAEAAEVPAEVPVQG